MNPIKFPLLTLPNKPDSLDYTPGRIKITTKYPERDKATHGQWLQNKFSEIWQQNASNLEQKKAQSLPVRSGTYIEFESQIGFPLKTKSLEASKKGIRLVNVREELHENKVQTFATVYIPAKERKLFIDKFRQYAVEFTQKNGNPKHEELASSIEDIKLAVLESFWVDPLNLIPQDVPKWCEVWLFTDSYKVKSELLSSFYSLCTTLGISFKEQNIYFPERIVTIIKANRSQLLTLVEACDYLAEFRLAQELASFWTSQYNIEQTEWVSELLSRLQVTDEANVRITILDSGINNGHALLNPILSDADCHTVIPEWKTDDHNGHGTLMAGICAYGDLQKSLESSSSVKIFNRLESAKILSRIGANDPDLYGFITSQGISLVEIQNPTALRIFCMAVTTSFQTGKGQPSSWSSAIDSITSGADDDEKRLFIISAGNVRESADWENYPDTNLLKSIESPAQSWNALSVGAYTKKVVCSDPDYEGYNPIAEINTLSPYSRTSLLWERNKWPNKPDIVLEGGNLLKSSDGTITPHDDLSILTTYFKPTIKQFNTINATSASTAQAVWMAAQIQIRYPNFWPETIRGLMVHSADWPDELFNQFRLSRNKKSDVAQMLHIAGYGVPNLQKAIECAQNSLTLISQNAIQPFKKDGSDYKTNEMHLFQLPWPKEILLGLGEVQVKLRITLSFFIEPGPGEVGWKDRYRYASHGLRFDLNNVNERKDEFITRINVAARDEDFDSSDSNGSGSDRWVIGTKNRKMGSLHSDVWTGNAADLASCNLIGVYPVIGWWRERHNLNCYDKIARYSLIVSLEVPSVDVDIYTIVKNMIEVPIAIKV
jgi:hypothetical protein